MASEARLIFDRVGKRYPAERSGASGKWALRELSFRLSDGDTLGVIGANGAGKTTCLKLAARVSRPTEGSVRANGRVAPLVDVGAGLHPDLTGRENVTFYGTMMGLRRNEVAARMAEILAFAELEHAADDPLREYSAGMQVRLAFSVVVHTRPDILLVDEMLAAGDAAFQARAVERVRALRDGGTAVVLVSHNLSLVSSFCARAALLEAGRCVSLGATADVVAEYARRCALPAKQESGPSADLEISGVEVQVGTRAAGAALVPGDDLTVVLRIRTSRVRRARCNLLIRRGDGAAAAGATHVLDLDPCTVVTASLRELRLVRGVYRVECYLSDVAHTADYAMRASGTFDVESALDDRFGGVALEADWSVRAD